MKIGKTFYAANRKQWRSWLAKNHRSEPEIWLVYYKKNSGKPRIPYNDAVEEALCYGWIDSTLKPKDEISYLQRFSPRRKNSKLSEMNKERVRRLIKAKKMTRFGLDIIRHHMENGSNNSKQSTSLKKFTMPEDILDELKARPLAWKNFKKFPESYKRIRIGWIDASRNHHDYFKKRLQYFLKMTEKNKMFGMVR
ncbi:MAG: YdeI/OmpD-associated family protein [Bacteroidota bacterium]